MQDNMGRRIKLVRDRGFFLTEGEESWGTAWRITGWINLPEENPELP